MLNSAMQLPSPNDDMFQLSRAPRAMRAAVETLCEELGRPVAEMEHLTMGEITQLAQEHYEQELPFFWQNWIDWCRAEGPQPMGEL
jgi:hypothetical protein